MCEEDITFVHLTFNTFSVQRYIISCTNGFCKSRKGFKRNVDLLTKGGNLCRHLMQLKNAPHLWSEFSVCTSTSAHTDDDMEIDDEASSGVDEQEPAIEKTFFDDSESNFNVVDGLWSFFV